MKDDSSTTTQCERCGAAIESKPDYPEVCDDCYAVYGSCCNEWESSGENDPSE
jgi:hypothetical protein